MQGGDKGRPREVFQFDALDGNLNFCDGSNQHVCQIAICIKTKNFSDNKWNRSTGDPD